MEFRFIFRSRPIAAYATHDCTGNSVIPQLVKKYVWPIIVWNFYIHFFSIAIYAATYWITGVNYNGVKENNMFSAICFSFNTFTTLGYGDFSPIKYFRLIASSQAFTGIITVPILISIVWLYCSERLHIPVIADEEIIGKTFTPDGIYGMMREITPEATKSRIRRKRRLKLVQCELCHTTNYEIEKYYDWVGRTHPIPLYVVRCECGHFTKPRSNAYFAAHEWNYKNLNLIKKLPLGLAELIFWFQVYLFIMFGHLVIRKEIWLTIFPNNRMFYISLICLTIAFVLRCYLNIKIRYHLRYKAKTSK